MNDERHWSASRAKRLQAALIASSVAPSIALLSRTWRWRVEGAEHLQALDRAHRPFIVAFWHGRIMPGLVYFRDRGIVVITSENFDGEWIARVIRRFGFATARGSSSRGSTKALLRLKREMAAGRSTAFTLDGPRGPRHVAQAGAVWLARATGCPLLPFHVEADRRWTLPSWDRGQVPKPFATLHLCLGAPIEVAADAPVDEAMVSLQRRLEALMVRAATLASVAPAVGPGSG